jgi:alpha-ketoglutarate-dependent taurine dioxygenase
VTGVVRLAAGGGGDWLQWTAARRAEFDALLLRHGAVLVTGLPIRSGPDLAAARDALGYRPAPCREQFAARRELGDGVYSAPEWAADREQCLHHEQGYAVDTPRVLLMACLTPAGTGGATLLGDTRAALRALPAGLVDRFREEGWLLTRNFRPHFGVPHSVAFGTSTADEVERFCAERMIDCRWRPDATLHASQRRAAVVPHPVTGEECWFNDVAFFSQWSVASAERDVLLAAFGPDGIPFNTCFGGGEPVDEAGYDTIMAGYDEVLQRVDWRAGDLVLLDNILTAHGREPYTGQWEIAVALAEPVPLPAAPPLPAAQPRSGPAACGGA